MSTFRSRPFVVYPLSLLAIAFAVWSALTLVSALANFRARSYIEAWAFQSSQPNPSSTQTGFSPDPDEMEAALGYARLSVRLSPYIGDFHRSLADVLSWKTLYFPKTEVMSGAESLQEYRTAIRLQPYWHLNQTGLAFMKSVMGEIDSEFMDALNNGFRNAPWDPGNLAKISTLGISHWEELDDASRKTVVNSIMHRLSWKLDDPDTNDNEAVQALVSLTQSGRRHDVCPLLDRSNPYVPTYCDTPD